MRLSDMTISAGHDVMQGVMIVTFVGLIVFPLISYLVGSIPFGLIFTRLAGLGDVRSIGSGNIGATNVLRTGNRKIAALTLLADMLKGTVVVAIIAMSDPDSPSILALLAGFFAFLGHLFPIWLKFKGGKGVATYLGILIVIFPWGAFVFVLIWLIVAVVSRYSSLAALGGVLAAALFSFFLATVPTSLTIALMSIIIFAKHHTNIRRLLAGTETKIELKGK